MGRELAESRAAAAETFAQADETLGWSLSTLMWEGTEQELRLTKNAQPAILTHSVAVWRVGRQTLGEAAIAAGHSLGEFSAHVAAGTLSFEDGLRAVRLRGELMFEAGQRRQGTMAAVLGLDDVDVGVLCESVTSGTCVPANFNSPGQVVLSGDAPGVAEGMERAKRAGGQKGRRAERVRCIPLAAHGAGSGGTERAVGIDPIPRPSLSSGLERHGAPRPNRRGGPRVVGAAAYVARPLGGVGRYDGGPRRGPIHRGWSWSGPSAVSTDATHRVGPVSRWAPRSTWRHWESDHERRAP